MQFMKELLPVSEYFRIVDSCSYAIFGVIREAAMGNIFRCISNGVKVFLYRDSIPYKFLTNLGALVFAIEDINEMSFRDPLSNQQAIANRQCLLKDVAFVNKVREQAIGEIQAIVAERRYH